MLIYLVNLHQNAAYRGPDLRFDVQFSVAWGENCSHSRETWTCWTEIGSVLETSRNGRAAQTANGSAYAGETPGTRLSAHLLYLYSFLLNCLSFRALFVFLNWIVEGLCFSNNRSYRQKLSVTYLKLPNNLVIIIYKRCFSSRIFRLKLLLCSSIKTSYNFSTSYQISYGIIVCSIFQTPAPMFFSSKRLLIAALFQVNWNRE